ncbi:MAG: flagellar hook-associated protein 3 [Kangiellaceae bacterium]|nr:flagellar hook-associated protein 3 [Kangiellaceae bacterium]|tara:strand:- start:9549 stop:10787 length:1239 start_codon:yes stop_codon:yes gene_type:complete
MRISNLQFGRPGFVAMQDNQELLNKTQEQLATGKRVNKPSDDPIAATAILTLKEEISVTQQYIDNSTAAKNKLELEESTLANVDDLILNIQELIIRGGSASLTETDKKTLADEIEVRFEQLMGMANTRGADGNYLFGGYQSRTQPFTVDNAGNVTYAGDEGVRRIQLSAAVTVPVSDNGNEIFMRVPNSLGDFQVTLGPTNDGTGYVEYARVVDNTTYVSDTYTLNFITNGAGNLAYQVVDSGGAVIDPAPPADPIINAQEFTTGQPITFNGIEVQVTDNPIPGDSFELQPSSSQDLFSIVQRAMDTLRRPLEDQGDYNQQSVELRRIIADLDEGLDNVLEVRSKVGARMNLVDKELQQNETHELVSTQNLSEIEDLDYADAISIYQRQLTALQAAQQSYTQITNLSIFNYL